MAKQCNIKVEEASTREHGPGLNAKPLKELVAGTDQLLLDSSFNIVTENLLHLSKAEMNKPSSSQRVSASDRGKHALEQDVNCKLSSDLDLDLDLVPSINCNKTFLPQCSNTLAGMGFDGEKTMLEES